MLKKALISEYCPGAMVLFCLLVLTSAARAENPQRIRMICSFSDSKNKSDPHEIIFIMDNKNGTYVLRDSVNNVIDFTPVVTKKDITMTSRFKQQPVQLVYRVERKTGNFTGHLKFRDRLVPKYTGYCRQF
jgi:hypothetical protein